MTTCILCGNSASCDIVFLPNPCTHVEENSALSCGFCSELSQLDQNVDGIKCALKSAVEQRHAYLEWVNHRYDPFQRLPVELVTFIFVLCLPRRPSLDVFESDVKDAMQKDLASRPVQFLLGSVCRFWRRMVLSTPQLWNILWLHVSPRTTMAQNEILVEWLSHSGQLPLYVAMFYIEEFYSSDDEGRDGLLRGTLPINQMIDTLYRYASRMRVLHLSLLGQHISRFGRHLPVPKAITHVFLKILNIAFDNPGPFLDYLTCPVLEELTYYCHPNLTTFLRRSACPLRKLCVEKFSGFSEYLVSVLLLTPLLTHLSLKDFGIPGQFLTCFAETAYFGRNNSETSSLLPHLRSFTCNVVCFHRFRWSKIPSLIPQPPDNTATAVRPLSEITITFDQEANLKDVRHAMDRESLVQTLKLVQGRGVVLRVKDIAGLDLIRWSELFHNMI